MCMVSWKEVGQDQPRRDGQDAIRVREDLGKGEVQGRCRKGSGRGETVKTILREGGGILFRRRVRQRENRAAAHHETI